LLRKFVLLLVSHLLCRARDHWVNFYFNCKLCSKFSYGIPISIFMIFGSIGGTTLSFCDPFHHKPREEIVLRVFECACDLSSHKGLPAYMLKKIIRYFRGLLMIFIQVRCDLETYRKKCAWYFIQGFNMMGNITQQSRLIFM